MAVSTAELQLALQLINQISEPAYDPTAFKDEEKQRVLDAIDRKIAGQQIVASSHLEDATDSGQVIDLMAALQASLAKKPARSGAPKPAAAKQRSNVTAMPEPKTRKGVKRAPVVEPEVAVPVARSRARK